MKIISDTELMEQFKVSKSFIARNARKMGSRGRPRKFIYDNVLRFFDEYFNAGLREEAARQEEIKQKSNLLTEIVVAPFSSTVTRIGEPVVGKILGRGGRVRKTDGRGTIDEGRKEGNVA